MSINELVLLIGSERTVFPTYRSSTTTPTGRLNALQASHFNKDGVGEHAEQQKSQMSGTSYQT